MPFFVILRRVRLSKNVAFHCRDWDAERIFDLVMALGQSLQGVIQIEVEGILWFVTITGDSTTMNDLNEFVRQMRGMRRPKHRDRQRSQRHTRRRNNNNSKGGGRHNNMNMQSKKHFDLCGIARWYIIPKLNESLEHVTNAEYSQFLKNLNSKQEFRVLSDFPNGVLQI